MRKRLFFWLIIFVPMICLSQQTIEFTLGAGYTAIDIEGLVEKDEISGTTTLDWGQANYGISTQYFLDPMGNISFGAELMYQYLYWYNVRVPFGSQPIRREYTVDAIKVTPMVRFGAGSVFSFDLGPEFNFSDGTEVGLMMSANYNIPISDNVEVPIKFRLDVINKIVVTAPISLNAGIRIML